MQNRKPSVRGGGGEYGYSVHVSSGTIHIMEISKPVNFSCWLGA